MGFFERVRKSLSLIVFSLVLGTVAGTVFLSLRDPRPAASSGIELPYIPLVTGIGEQLVIVLGGLYDSQAEAQSAADSFNLGDMHAYFVDTTDNYSTLGFYAQTTPNMHRLTCGQDLPLLECPSDPTIETFSQPSISLEYVSKSNAQAYLQEHMDDPCGGVDQPPCLSEVIKYLQDGSTNIIPNKWFLLSAFRTGAGAIDFMQLARVGGRIPVALRVTKIAGPYVGLGWEPDPDGSGLLLGPLTPEETAKYQESLDCLKSSTSTRNLC